MHQPPSLLYERRIPVQTTLLQQQSKPCAIQRDFEPNETSPLYLQFNFKMPMLLQRFSDVALVKEDGGWPNDQFLIGLPKDRSNGSTSARRKDCFKFGAFAGWQN
jgi:hypothetical protein